MSFQLDTSGAVVLPKIDAGDGALYREPVCWSDLSPFMQGYIEAAMRDAVRTTTWLTEHTFVEPAFNMLAPETLARIISDCEAASALKNGWTPMYRKTRAGGAAFWRDRSAYPGGWRTGSGQEWPPLTVQLGDDGKVRFTTPARSEERRAGE